MDTFGEIIRRRLPSLNYQAKIKDIINSTEAREARFLMMAAKYAVLHHGPISGEDWKEGYIEMRKALAEVIPGEETRKIVAEHTEADGYITLYRGCSKEEARRIRANKGYYPAGLFWTYSQAYAATYAQGGAIVRLEIPAVFVRMARKYPSGVYGEFNFILTDAAPFVRNIEILSPMGLSQRK